MDPEPLHPDLVRLIESVEILSAQRYRVDGRTCRVESVEKTRFEGLSPLAGALASDLYDLYNHQAPSTPGLHDGAGDKLHVARLSRANSGRGSWEPGRIHAVGEGGAVVIERRGVRYEAVPHELEVRGGDPVAGAACRVRIPKEMLGALPGFYRALGDAERSPGTDGEPEPLVRLYWHLRAEGAACWVRSLTFRFNREAIPFVLKLPSSPRHYARSDAGVVFLEPGAWQAARGTVEETYRLVRHHLRPEVPLMTVRLAPGLGVAEGPADRSSFGEHRCGRIATALERSFLSGLPARRAVAEAFRADRLDPCRPHLAAGSTSWYPPLSRSAAGSPRTPARSPSFEKAALRLGEALCRDAFWHGERCNWVGRPCEEENPGTGRFRPAVAAMGADLYAGTAGIGLFLGELFAETGEPASRRAARGALRQALAALEAEPDRYRAQAFYTGRLGVAWAARRVARQTGDEELAAGAEKLTSSLAEIPGGRRLLDAVFGDERTAPGLVDRALVERLILGATPPRSHNPSLFLGTAGVGYLLLRLRGAPDPVSPLSEYPR